MWVRVVVLSVPLAIAACAAEQEVARDVTRVVVEEPRYCYRHFVGRDGIRCFKTPVHRDERHLVGYTGPPPDRFPKPIEREPRLYAPDAVSYWVKDAELLPEPAAIPPGKRVAPPPVRDSFRNIKREPLKRSDKKSPSTLLKPLSIDKLRGKSSQESNNKAGNLLESERQAVMIR